MAVLVNWNGPKGFSAFARDLHKWYPELRLQLLRNLRLAGAVVQQEAKKNASYSHEIPPSLKVRVRGLQVSVQTPRTAIRALEEFSPGQWSHPVFGNLGGQSNVTQMATPYLYPAVKDKADEVEALVAEALEAANLAVCEA